MDLKPNSYENPDQKPLTRADCEKVAKEQMVHRICAVGLDDVVNKLVEQYRIAYNLEGICCIQWMDNHPTDPNLLQCPKCGGTKPKITIPFG